MRKLLKKHGFAPKLLVTDKLRDDAPDTDTCTHAPSKKQL
jgi:hypothetical protein